MGMEVLNLQASAITTGPIAREFVRGTEIRRRVQQRIDDHPELRNSRKKIIAPMPKPAASESPTGCNWTMHYLGQFPGCEPIIDAIVETVQHEANIGGPVSGAPQR